MMAVVSTQLVDSRAVARPARTAGLPRVGLAAAVTALLVILALAAAVLATAEWIAPSGSPVIPG